MKILTPAQLEFYKEQGYLIVEDFLAPQELARLRGALDRLVAERAGGLNRDQTDFNLEKVKGPDGYANPFGGQAIAGVLRKIQEITKHSPEFREFAEGERLLDLVQDLIGPTIYYHSSKLMFKPARHGGSKPWHQDYAYWASTKPEQVTVWMPLDDATPENGCMQLIPGSHKWGLLKHVREELQVDPKDLPTERIRVAPMKAGSLLAFHVLTLHHSGPNHTDRHRRAFIVDYDPNRREVRGGFAGDRLLRQAGRRPAPAESAAAGSAEIAARA